jgi:serine phosphatase RsbU (regulator of sigma subunit)
MEIREGDVIYLYSDGYEDQFGGEKNKKFSRYRFRELLLEIHEQKMSEQKRMLLKTLDDWMNGEDQVDDVTVMGIRF